MALLQGWPDLVPAVPRCGHVIGGVPDGWAAAGCVGLRRLQVVGVLLLGLPESDGRLLTSRDRAPQADELGPRCRTSSSSSRVAAARSTPPAGVPSAAGRPGRRASRWSFFTRRCSKALTPNGCAKCTCAPRYCEASTAQYQPYVASGQEVLARGPPPRLNVRPRGNEDAFPRRQSAADQPRCGVTTITASCAKWHVGRFVPHVQVYWISMPSLSISTRHLCGPTACRMPVTEGDGPFHEPSGSPPRVFGETT